MLRAKRLKCGKKRWLAEKAVRIKLPSEKSCRKKNRKNLLPG